MFKSFLLTFQWFHLLGFFLKHLFIFCFIFFLQNIIGTYICWYLLNISVTCYWEIKFPFQYQICLFFSKIRYLQECTFIWIIIIFNECILAESDSEFGPSAYSPLQTSTRTVRVKTLEEIKLEKIQAESAALYSYNSKYTIVFTRESIYHIYFLSMWNFIIQGVYPSWLKTNC